MSKVLMVSAAPHCPAPITTMMCILKKIIINTSVASPGSYLPCWLPPCCSPGCMGTTALQAELCWPGCVTFPPVHGTLNIAAASTTRRRFKICQKLSGHWPGDWVKMTHMLKAEKQLTANRLCRGSEISEHNWGRAAQQTDPVICGNGAASQYPPHHWSLSVHERVVCPSPLA